MPKLHDDGDDDGCLDDYDDPKVHLDVDFGDIMKSSWKIGK